MIRPLVASDLEQIKAIDEASFPPDEQYDDVTYARMLQSGLSLVAVDCERIVGYAFVQINPYTHIRSFAVHPEFRRRGYGKALLQAIIDSAEREVDLLVLETNAPAIRLYESFGFKRAAKRPMPSRVQMVLRIAPDDAKELERTSVWTDARLSCVRFGGVGPPALLVHGLYGRAMEWVAAAIFRSRNGAGRVLAGVFRRRHAGCGRRHRGWLRLSSGVVGDPLSNAARRRRGQHDGPTAHAGNDFCESTRVVRLRRASRARRAFGEAGRSTLSS